MKYTEQFAKHEYLTDKCWPHTYGPKIYDDLFEPIQHTVRNYLELGSAYGGSALLARDYFTRATVWTVDIVSPNRRIQSSDRIITLQADAYQKRIADMFPPDMDIIIDDASHNIEHQQKAIELYLSKLTVGGHFIIEDVESPTNSFKLFDKKVDEVYNRLKARGNMYLDYEVSTYEGPEYYANVKPGREEQAEEEMKEYGELRLKAKNDNLYIVKRKV
tara:strand:- start:3405 stop:4058 length:654 start_codon:yes stop_codon:yes gene_type:complete